MGIELFSTKPMPVQNTGSGHVALSRHVGASSAVLQPPSFTQNVLNAQLGFGVGSPPPPEAYLYAELQRLQQTYSQHVQQLQRFFQLQQFYSPNPAMNFTPPWPQTTNLTYNTYPDTVWALHDDNMGLQPPSDPTAGPQQFNEI